MLTDNITFLGLTFSAILIFILMLYLLKMKRKTQLHKVFIVNCSLTLLWAIALIAQMVLSPMLNIDPIKFDYIVYIGACFLPVSLLITGLVFANTKVKFSVKHLLLFVVPIISLIILWTNDYHHLFYVHYSTYIPETSFGMYFTVHSVYSYLCIGVGLWYLLSYAIKNSGFFSKQSLIIILGTLFPTIVNVLGYLGVLKLSIYITPITYIVTLFCYAIAMFKLQLFESSPIALQRVVDRISDGYLVLDDYNRIIDFNETFLKTFNIASFEIRNLDIFALSNLNEYFQFNKDILGSSLKSVKDSDETVKHEIYFKNINKYFVIEITGITHKDSFLGTIILFKDITQHIFDMEQIRDNQDKLMEKERLASLGQLIGGIAHNLKTPIMSISGATEGLTDLIKEYSSSVGDPEVTVQDHHDIAKDMQEWVDKIKSYDEYMSDVITAVKGQAVTLSDEESYTFSVEELIKRVDILMRHELKSSLVNLNVIMKLDASKVMISGNVNSLVQVIDNIISNDIQAYNGKENETIEMTCYEENNSIVISIKDYAGGLPKEVKDKLFKEMVTTKGKNGTGLGMFMSYSTIRAHFAGNITFESVDGEGTTFNIILPKTK